MTVTVATLYSEQDPVTYKQANISDTSGSLTVVAGVANKVIRVWRLALYALAGTDFTFNSHNTVGPVDTPIYGPIGFGGTSGQGNWLDPSQVHGSLLPWFQTLPGENLLLTFTAASRVSGLVTYTIENPSP